MTPLPQRRRWLRQPMLGRRAYQNPRQCRAVAVVIHRQNRAKTVLIPTQPQIQQQNLTNWIRWPLALSNQRIRAKITRVRRGFKLQLQINKHRVRIILDLLRNKRKLQIPPLGLKYLIRTASKQCHKHPRLLTWAVDRNLPRAWEHSSTVASEKVACLLLLRLQHSLLTPLLLSVRHSVSPIHLP